MPKTHYVIKHLCDCIADYEQVGPDEAGEEINVAEWQVHCPVCGGWWDAPEVTVEMTDEQFQALLLAKRIAGRIELHG